jgi:hypothetical protein
VLTFTRTCAPRRTLAHGATLRLQSSALKALQLALILNVGARFAEGT